MDLKTLQQEWKTDSKIDPLILGDQALGIPSLHSKYLALLSDEKVKFRKLTIEKKRLERKLSEYYHGKLDGKDIGREPYQCIVSTRSQLEKLLESDTDMIVIDDKVSESEEVILFIKEVIYSINGRSFVIKNYIDWNKWLNGGSL